MIVLGADTHKRSHTITAVSLTSGELLGGQTVQSGAKGAAALLALGARPRRCAGVGVRGLPACLGLMGAVCDSARRTRPARAQHAHVGRSASSARTWQVRQHRRARGRWAAVREGLDRLPAAHLDGPEPDLRLLVDHRERLVRQRVAINNTLQGHLPDLWPEIRFPGSALFHGTGGPRIARRLARAEQTMRVRIARDALRRIGELTQTITALVAQMAPHLLSEPGFGPRHTPSRQRTSRR